MNGGLIEQIATPQELYHHPKTRFVAGFIGSPAMNFMRCRLVIFASWDPLRGMGVSYFFGLLRRLPLDLQNPALPLISTAWDEKGFDALTSRDVAALKLPSSALERPSLLRHVAQTQKPLFVSTAHADLSKLAAAVDTIEDAGCQTFVLLHSVDQSRHDGRGALLRLTTLRHAFGVPVGLSDCDDNDAIAGAAAALGASVLEKYVSAIPSLSFGQMIRHIRDVESRLAGPTPQ
jgi:hypothetical protein